MSKAKVPVYLCNICLNYFTETDAIHNDGRHWARSENTMKTAALSLTVERLLLLQTM
jgi:hypothetical protein